MSYESISLVMRKIVPFLIKYNHIGFFFSVFLRRIVANVHCKANLKKKKERSSSDCYCVVLYIPSRGYKAKTKPGDRHPVQCTLQGVPANRV